MLAFLCWTILFTILAALVRNSPAAIDILILANAAVLLFLIRRDFRRRRQAREAAQAPSGLCPSCGYDLRATPNRCPECGLSLTKPIIPRIHSPRLAHPEQAKAFVKQVLPSPDTGDSGIMPP
jgi:hypothetical protein